MREQEFTKSSDNTHWMDTAVISDRPYKITIIDPRPFIVGMMNILESLPCVDKRNFSTPALEHLSKVIIHSIMTGVVNRRRAWINGDDVDFLMHLSQLREVYGMDIDPVLRDDIRYEMTEIRNRRAADFMDGLINEIVEVLTSHMNPNKFVVHELTQTRDLRTFLLEEYADWRVIQWTKEQQAKIDERHEAI